jgi:hypothetical protein
MRFSGEWKFALAAGHVNFREDLPQTAQIAVLPAGTQGIMGRQPLWLAAFDVHQQCSACAFFGKNFGKND